MPTVKVYRYDVDTNQPLSTFVRVGKFGTDKADKKDTATVSEFHFPYLTKPNGNLYAIEIYNPSGYSFTRIKSSDTSFTRGGDIWYKFPITSANAVINIRLYFKSTTVYYKVGALADISSGEGIVGPLGPEGQGLRWSGNSVKDRISVERGKYVGIEVFNVENYATESVEDATLKGSLSLHDGLWFQSNNPITSNRDFLVHYRSLLHTLYARTSTGGSIKTVYNGTTYVDNRDITVKEGNSFTMTATPNTANHYKFLYWLKDNVLYSYNATITPTMGSSDVTYQAIFQQYSSHTVKVEPKPPLTNYGGDIYINGVKTHSATFYEDTGIRLEWNAVTTTRRFDYWEYTIGNLIQNDNRVTTITGVTSDITIYVQWHEIKQNITAIPTPYAGGYVQITNVTKNTSSQSSGSNKASLDWENGDNVVIDYVITGEGYRFNYWDITNRTYDSSGVPTRHYTSTKFQLPMTDYPFDDYDVRCNLQEQYTIRVARNQPWGTAYLLLQDGTHTDEFTYFPTEIVTMVAEPNEGYKFDGWTGGDGVDTSGLDLTQSTLSFTIESKREGTWIANFSVQPIAIGVRDNIDNTHAYAVVNGKHYSNWLYTYGDAVYIYAEEVTGYKFVKWETTAEASIDYTSRVLNFTASTSYGGYYTAIYEPIIPGPVVGNVSIIVLWQLLFRKKKAHKKVYIKR